jgi:hypothetical protein
MLSRTGECEAGTVYEAMRPGIGRAEWDQSVFIRISSKQYVGLARYRHLEGDDV